MADNEQSVQQQFAIQRLYVKDLSFETPMGPKVFTLTWKPGFTVDLNTSSKKIEDNLYEVVLQVTVTTRLDDEVVALIEVQQAGLFVVTGFEGDDLRRALTIGAPSLLFPYLREVVDSTAVRGGFPPVGLQPVNFEALYMQAVAKSRQEAQPTAH